jgi:hypothetical protein
MIIVAFQLTLPCKGNIIAYFANAKFQTAVFAEEMLISLFRGDESPDTIRSGAKVWFVTFDSAHVFVPLACSHKQLSTV